MRNNLLSGLLIIHVAALVFCHCSPAQPRQSEFTVGAIYALTGDWAVWGERCRKASLLAQDELNAGTGINGRKLKLVIEDSPGLPRTALSAYHKLRSIEKAEQIIGPFTAEELTALAPLAERDKVFISTYVYTPIKPRYSALIWIHPDIEARALAIELRRNYSRAAILSSDMAWDQSISELFKKHFESMGGTVAAAEFPSQTTKDVRGSVLRAKSSSPEVLFIPSYIIYPQYVREISKLKWTLPIYGAEFDQSLVDQSGAGANGSIFIRPAPAKPEFAARYNSRFNEAADLPSSQCYDAVMLLAHGINKVGNNAEALSGFFSNLHDYPGASGLISFVDGQTVMPLEWCRIRDLQVGECQAR